MLRNHVNYATEKEGTVYCRLLNSVVQLDDYHLSSYCAKCPMYAGSAQGNGVECQWYDSREGESVEKINDPVTEYQSVQINDIVNPKASIKPVIKNKKG